MHTNTNRVPRTYRLPADVVSALDMAHMATGIDRTEIVSSALIGALDIFMSSLAIEPDCRD